MEGSTVLNLPVMLGLVNQYSGDTSVLDFLDQIEDLSQLDNLGDKEKIIVLKCKCTGEAKEIVKNTLSQDKNADFNSLKKALIDRFMLDEPWAIRMAKFTSCKQNTHESVKHYASRLEGLAVKCLADHDSSSEVSKEFRDRNLLSQFLSGLTNSLKRFVLVHNPKTYEEAKTNAVLEEQNEACISNFSRKVNFSAEVQSCEEESDEHGGSESELSNLRKILKISIQENQKSVKTLVEHIEESKKTIQALENRIRENEATICSMAVHVQQNQDLIDSLSDRLCEVNFQVKENSSARIEDVRPVFANVNKNANSRVSEALVLVGEIVRVPEEEKVFHESEVENETVNRVSQCKNVNCENLLQCKLEDEALQDTCLMNRAFLFLCQLLAFLFFSNMSKSHVSKQEEDFENSEEGILRKETKVKEENKVQCCVLETVENKLEPLVHVVDEKAEAIALVKKFMCKPDSQVQSEKRFVFDGRTVRRRRRRRRKINKKVKCSKDPELTYVDPAVQNFQEKSRRRRNFQVHSEKRNSQFVSRSPEFIENSKRFPVRRRIQDFSDKRVKIGDHVLVHPVVVVPRRNSGLMKFCRGPFFVSRIFSDVSIEVTLLTNPSRKERVHVRRLIKVNDNCNFSEANRRVQCNSGRVNSRSVNSRTVARHCKFVREPGIVKPQ